MDPQNEVMVINDQCTVNAVTLPLAMFAIGYHTAIARRENFGTILIYFTSIANEVVAEIEQALAYYYKFVSVTSKSVQITL